MRHSPRSSSPAALAAAGIALAGLVLGGCLAYESAEFRFRTDPASGVASAHVTYHHVESSENDSAGRRKDFADLVEGVTGDKPLLDALHNGQYMRNRKLFLEGGVVSASCDVLAKDMASLGHELPETFVFGDSSVFAIEESDSLLATNGSYRVWSESRLSSPRDTLLPQPPPRDSTVELRLIVWPAKADPMWARFHGMDLRGASGFVALYRDWVRHGRPTARAGGPATAAR